MCSNDDVMAMVDDETFEKQLKFSLMKENRDYRECPKAGCHNMMLGNKKEPVMVCDKCGTNFCFFHNDAHPNKSCWQYAWQSRKAEIAAKRKIVWTTKACPGCGAPTEKMGGVSEDLLRLAVRFAGSCR